MHIHNSTNQISDISILRFISELRNLMHVVRMHNDGTDIILRSSSSGRTSKIESGNFVKLNCSFLHV